MLAYLFWHKPQESISTSAYERAVLAFQHSLEHSPPAGFCGCATYRVEDLWWLGDFQAGYEDWYLLEDWNALGVLRYAAVAHGHVSLHDRAARHFASGAGGLYSLREGTGDPLASEQAIWITPTHASTQPGVADLLADGLQTGSLWRRELVLGPGPEYCLLEGSEKTHGVLPTRLPQGWRARSTPRERLTHSDA